MKRFLSDCKLILSGKKLLDEAWKLSNINYCVGIIHLIFTIAFTQRAMTVLAFYNFLITLFYFFLGYRMSKKVNHKLMYFSSMIEIIFHSILATMMVGWDCGFMIYTISLVAVSFYFMIAINDFNHKLRYPLSASIIITMLFIATNHFSRQITPFYDKLVTDNFSAGFYYFNAFVAFAICFIFSLLFTLEVFYTQNQLMHENDTLDKMASCDPLTKLLNRRSMETHLDQVMDHAKKTGAQFTVIMGDIDNFKKVNDTYGHDCGDKVLVMISEAIRSQMRSEDQLCRWGGEEFLLLIHTNGQYAAETAERVRKAVSEVNVPIDNSEQPQTISVTMTFGVSSYIPGYSMERLIKIADNNLYIGKSNGKNQVVS